MTPFSCPRFRFVSSLLVASALTLVGCGDDDDAPPVDLGTGSDLGSPDLGTPDLGGDVDGGTSDDLGTGADDLGTATDAGPGVDAAFPAGMLTIRGVLREQPVSGMGELVAGASVCVIEPAGGPCVTSGADGSFTATGIPENTRMLVEITAPMYQPAYATVTSGTTDVSFNYLLAKRSTVSLLGFAIGQTINAMRGQIFVQTGVADVVVTLAPASGTGPFYASAAGVPSMGLSATTSSGAAVFANVEPGDYVVTFAHPTLTCVATGFAWAGTAAETTDVRVAADHISSTVVDCR
jgi:hypothetical protein